MFVTDSANSTTKMVFTMRVLQILASIRMTSSDVRCHQLFLLRLETINNLSLATSGVDDRFHFAHKIAADLFLYMTSFSQGENMYQQCSTS